MHMIPQGMADPGHGDGGHQVNFQASFLLIASSQGGAQVVAGGQDREAVDEGIDAGGVGPFKGTVGPAGRRELANRGEAGFVYQQDFPGPDVPDDVKIQILQSPDSELTAYFP